MSVGLWQDLSQWAWSWYADDRIRASPAEGRLLRVLPGDLITLHGIEVTVIERSISEGSADQSIRLTCSKEHGIGELRVTVADLETLELVWTEAGRSRRMEKDEVQVWPRSQ